MGTDKTLLLLLRNDNEESGWGCDFVAIQDLFEDPEILREKILEAENSGNYKLANYRSQALLAITQQSDL